MSPLADPVFWCAVGAGLATVHTGVNGRLLRRPPAAGTPAVEPPTGGPTAPAVAVLLPVRDEADRVAPCLRSLLAQTGVPGLRILVLDDNSTDGTADVVRAIADGADQVELLTGRPLPAGWLGKPYACQQLAEHATGAEILIFVDADVVLTPHAVAATVGLLAGQDLVSPYPRIVAPGAQRLVQPLLQWSWLTFLPLRLAERSRRASLTAAGGQLLAVRREAYHRAGGHAAVADRILEDIELARAVKRAGGRVALADGSALAECAMYPSWPAMADGYTKSLRASFGSPAGAVAVLAMLAALYLVPPLAAVAGLAALAGPAELADGLGWPTTTAGLAGYGFGVLGRVFAARATGGRAWPDALAHPISVALFAALVVRSYARRRSATWKGRAVGAGR